MDRVRAFVRREAVLVVAAVLALASCALVPPDAAYAGYIDWHMLALLFCLMAVVAGFRSLGMLDAAGAWLVSRATSQRQVAFALVGLAFFASMAVTNDVALITFVPLALVTIRAAGMDGRLCAVATLMTIAANLGSMFLPIGNPQNLYLFTSSGMPFPDFVLLMLPYTALSGALLALAVAVCFPGAPCDGGGRATGEKASSWRDHPARLAAYAALFCLCVLAVAGLADVRVALAATVALVALMDAALFRRVDYALLLTFVALFVFVGNMARVPAVHDAIAGLVAQSALVAAVGASQVISNVPAAVLLSGFTDQWGALIVGANLGGLGTLIASMASLITFKAVSIGRAGARSRYLKTFTLANVAFLAVLLGVALLLGV